MIAEKQKLDLIWQMVTFLLIALSFYIGGHIVGDVEVTLWLLTISRSFAYIINVMMSYTFSKGGGKALLK